MLFSLEGANGNFYYYYSFCITDSMILEEGEEPNLFGKLICFSDLGVVQIDGFHRAAFPLISSRSTVDSTITY